MTAATAVVLAIPADVSPAIRVASTAPIPPGVGATDDTIGANEVDECDRRERRAGSERGDGDCQGEDVAHRDDHAAAEQFDHLAGLAGDLTDVGERALRCRAAPGS